MLKRSGLAIIILLGAAALSVTNSGANIVNTACVFYYGGSCSDTCTIVPPLFYSIKGKIKDSDGKGIAYVKVVLSGDKSAVYWTKENGCYEFTGLPGGNYTVTPNSAYCEGFEPTSRNYAPLDQDYEDQDFGCGIPPPIVPINNLFNPVKGEYTTILYGIDKRCHVTLRLYNLLGEPIITLVDEEKKAGSYSIDWFGKNKEGSTVASGTYFLYFKAGGYEKIEKIIVIK